jgi:hypothetical protein
MILQFRCTPEIKTKIDDLVQRGLYPDFSAFCVVALENQLLLEDAPTSLTEPAEPRKLEPAGEPKRVTKSESGPRPRTRARSSRSNGIPQECTLTLVPETPPFPLRDQLSSVFSPTDTVPINRWLLGHYNRLLPAKVSCRALVNLAKDGKVSLVVDEIAPLIAEVAAQVGEHLRALDEEQNSHRDEALCIAFPEPGERGAKGRLRFQNHFVGQMVKGQQEGLLVGLKLAFMEVKRNRPLITPTQAGWEFAQLPNPILENGVDRPKALSDQEIEFLLAHIERNVPVELFAYRLVLSLIREGKDSPESTNQALMKYVDTSKKLSGEIETYISTQRGGVLGRMKDLQLIHRERIGTSFRYHVSERGAAFLARVGEVR